jgi:hypothetical protein
MKCIYIFTKVYMNILTVYKYCALCHIQSVLSADIGSVCLVVPLLTYMQVPYTSDAW